MPDSDSRHAGVSLQQKDCAKTAEMWGGAPAKSTYCDLSSFGPELFEICWPDIYLGGPYGPVKDKMYWPGGLKSAPGQCLCRGLVGLVLNNPGDLQVQYQSSFSLIYLSNPSRY